MAHSRGFPLRRLFLSAAAVVAMMHPLAAAATSAPMGAIAGAVESADGAPIAGAALRLDGSSGRFSYASDGGGKFAGDVPAGIYVLSARAKRSSAISGVTVSIAPFAVTRVDLTMVPAQASSISVLGHVTVNGADTVSTSPSHVVDVSASIAAGRGVTSTSDLVATELSTTVVPQAGGGYNAPTAIALRGPDPSETLIEIDGHQVNNGNAGAFDMSLLDPADLQSVQIAYGIAPSSLFGPDTLGGAINIRTLEPTQSAHALLRFSAGSFGTIGQTAQATGSDRDLGYAASFHRVTSTGEVDAYPFQANGIVSLVGDGLVATSSIVKLRYDLDGGEGFLGVSLRDQAVYRDLSASLSSVGQSVTSGAGAALLGHNAAYGIDALVPIGVSSRNGPAQTTALFSHLTSLVSQSSEGPAATASPFLYNDRDVITDDTLEITHAFDRGSLSVKFADQSEDLQTYYIAGGANSDSVALNASAPPARFGQTSRSIGALYAWDATSKLHYSVAAYASDYSTFGHSFDPRAGIVWTPDSGLSLRASIGTTFQSPQLPSLYVPPVLPPPSNGYINIGNPHLEPDKATEYDIGYDRFLSSDRGVPSLSVDVYRSDLYNAIATFIPPTTCQSPPTGPPPCLSYPVNAASQVYTGAEIRIAVPIGASTLVRAGFGVDSVYLPSVPKAIQSGSLVPGEQFLGVPLHKGTLDISRDSRSGISWYAGVLYEGAYNELNRPPYATVQGGATIHRGALDIGLYGTNLTQTYADKFLRVGGGVPYAGLAGPIATDALPLAARTVTLVVTLHR